MKYSLMAILLSMNLIIHSMDQGRNSSVTGQQLEEHQNHLPTCPEIIACIKGCCQAVWIIGCIMLEPKPTPNIIRDHDQSQDQKPPDHME